jgi:hypothetical protein
VTTCTRISVLIALALGLTVFHATAKQTELPHPAVQPTAPPAAGQTAITTAILGLPCKLDKPIENMTVAELFRKLSDLHGVTFRLDVGHFRRMGVAQAYDKKVSLPIVRGLTVRDVLQEVMHCSDEECGGLRLGIQVKGSQIIIAKGFTPPNVPGAHRLEGTCTPLVAMSEIQDTFYGPIVGIAVDKKPLADVINQLRESSGANIVVDPRVKEKLTTPVTITANDTRLMTVLKFAGDMCDVAPAAVDNIYYITTRENAERLNREMERTVFGEPKVPVPAGFVTDGINLFEKPAGLKPADTSKLPKIIVPILVPESVVKPPAPAPVEKK